MRLKSGRSETWTRYSCAPAFGRHAKWTLRPLPTVRVPCGFPSVRVNGRVTDQGPETVPARPCGKFARTRQRKTPVPVIFVAVRADDRIARKSFCEPSGSATCMS